MALPWLYSIVFTAGLSLSECPKDFSTQGYYLYYACSPNATSTLFILTVDYTNFYTPLLMLVLYGVTYSYMRRHGNSAVSKHELRFLLQSFLICGIMFVEALFFALLPTIDLGGQWEFVLGFIGGNTAILVTCNDPTVILVFNGKVRDEAKHVLQWDKWWQWGKVGNSVTVVNAPTRTAIAGP
jgi:uncharacterized membrane protein